MRPRGFVATGVVPQGARTGAARDLSYCRCMPDTPYLPSKTWRYHFTRPGGDEVEAGDFTGDEPAIARARDLSTSMREAIVVERYGLVDWHYVDEVDERP